MEPIIECVPNFSEGQRPEVIQQITAAMQDVPGTRLLDVQSDADHNRTVVTMIGSPQALKEAAFQGIARAAQLIDMEKHQGEHPRIGATDVVPFIPIQAVTLEDCVQLAQELGRRVGEELRIPVYLYEAAATRPERVNLADIRRGEYQGLKAEIETNPNRAPDFGPARLGSAGATVIGARPFLIAYNVYLNTSDAKIAQRIARAIRHTSGGLRFIKAMGLLVEGQAQVSMNLTDFSRTPIHRAVELIRQEAGRYGVSVTHSELVGLAPQQALLDAAAWYLQLDLDPEQVLENRLHRQAPADGPPFPIPDGFLDAVASDSPAPGGGSVAALAGALTAALTAMVARLTLGRKKYANVQTEMETLLVEAEELRTVLTARIAQDAEAYNQVIAAYRLPKESKQEKAARQDAIQQGLIHAAEVPLATARDAVQAMALANTAARLGNTNARTDATVAAHLARAAFEGAVLNVEINADQVTDPKTVKNWQRELKELREQITCTFKDTLAIGEEL